MSEPDGQHTHPGWSLDRRLASTGDSGRVGIRAPRTPQTRGRMVGTQARDQSALGAAAAVHVSNHRGSPAALPIRRCSLSRVAQLAALRTSLNRSLGKRRPHHCLLAEGRPVRLRPARGGGASAASGRGGASAASGLYLGPRALPVYGLDAAGRSQEHFRPVLETARGRELFRPVLGAGRGRERFRSVRGAGRGRERFRPVPGAERAPPHSRGRCERAVPAPRPAERHRGHGRRCG